MMSELLPIVDAHVHLWNPDQFSMPWLASTPTLNRPYGLQEYRQQTQGLPVIGMVYIEVGIDQDEAEPDFCLRPDFVAGVRLLAEYNLSFDLCIKHWQLPSVVELVRRCPDTAFILDHLGKPDIKQQLLDP